MLGMYEFATSQKFSPLLIDTEAEKDKKFRKGFLEVFDLSAFAYLSHTRPFKPPPFAPTRSGGQNTISAFLSYKTHLRLLKLPQ